MAEPRSPYEILGVARDADADTIRRAGRAAAARVHPDAGGTAEAFQEVQAARELLGDAEARAAYDRDGTWPGAKGPDNAMARLHQEAAARFLQVVQQASEPERVDIIDVVLREIVQEKKKHQAEIAGRRKAAAQLERVAARVTRKAPKPVDGEAAPPPENLLKRMIQAQAAFAIAPIPQIEAELAFLERLAGFIGEHGFEVERTPPPAVRIGEIGNFSAGRFFTSSSTA